MDLTRSCGHLEAAVLPRKTPSYFCIRFLLHPIYRYGVHGIHVSERLCGLIASRLAPATGSHALPDRWLLWDRRHLRAVRERHQAAVAPDRCQYADLFSVGLSGEALAAAGFAPVDKDESFGRLENSTLVASR